MDIREFLPKTVMSATSFVAEFGDEPQIWKVERVWEYEPPNSKEVRAAVKFHEHPLSVVVNTTRGEAVSAVLGTHCPNWVGHTFRVTHGPEKIGQKKCRTIVFEVIPGEAASTPGKSWRPEEHQ